MLCPYLCLSPSLHVYDLYSYAGRRRHLVDGTWENVAAALIAVDRLAVHRRPFDLIAADPTAAHPAENSAAATAVELAASQTC